MSRRKPAQLALDLQKPRTHGGARARAGRRKSRPGTWMPHRIRPFHDENHPVHVTLRVRRGVPNLRGYKLAAAIGAGLRLAATAPWTRQAQRRRTFRVIHFSIQPNHIHLIVEASSASALARGVGGLASGLARRINHGLRRKGRLFSDRYHAHALATPTEVRRAIVYVLNNHMKHPVPIPDRGTEPQDGIDPLSSARWFDGWQVRPPAPAAPPPVASPHTWLAGIGWKRAGGTLHRHERPAPVSARQ
jgi:REP element-mobilizing transposase RayT